MTETGKLTAALRIDCLYAAALENLENKGVRMGKKRERRVVKRQLRLYELLCRYPIVQYEDIMEIYPYNKRMLQRDLADLRDAGLVEVKYSRKAGGYVKTGTPGMKEGVNPGREIYLKSLNRLGRLMAELENEDVPFEDKEECQEYLTAKESYHMLFPEMSESTRQRDFQLLSEIGYVVRYDSSGRYFWTDGFEFSWQDAPEQLDEEYLDGNWE